MGGGVGGIIDFFYDTWKVRRELTDKSTADESRIKKNGRFLRNAGRRTFHVLPAAAAERGPAAAVERGRHVKSARVDIRDH